MIGKVIKDNYKIMDEIGRGSVATVYLAKDMARNQVVALKIIHPERAAEGQFLQRFQREAKLLQMLTSPQAVKVLDYGEDEGLNFIALEYVQGETLVSILEEEGPVLSAVEGLLEVNRALDIAKQVALCLVDAHAKSIVHRDLRPANIMVTADGTVKVMDFGIAWGAELSRLTATGVLGSPHYLSPEQASGGEVNGRSDIYSLGVILFEVLSGRKPYDADSAVDIVLAHLQEPIPSLHQLDESIPLEVDELVRKCLAKKPEDRYQSAAELLEAIDTTLRVIASRKEGIAMGMEANLGGQTLGAYRIIEQIGRGGMATVYKAYEPALDRYVAVKVLPQYFAHDPDFAARFEREAKAVAKLNHPNILPIYSFGQEAGLTYIAMRYVEAGTLKEMLGQPLDLKTAADILGQIGRALDYAHRQGVVHRDVKPTNVLMAEGEWALLTDFGLARMVESSVQLTKSGVGVGTPAYMSPEQGQGIKVDARSDVYSLGVVLYEMVTGKVPYEAETPMAIVIKHITAPLPLPREVNPDLPEAIERVILKAMAKAPEDRYQTAGEMVEALEKAVAGVPVVERPPEVKPVPVEEVPSAVVAEPTPAPAVAVPVEAPPVTKKGLPGWVWGVVGAVVLVVAGGIFLATQGGEPSPTPEATAALVATPIPPAQPERDKFVEPCEGVTPSQICVRDAETDQITQVTDSLEFGLIGWCTWSPDGQQIVFNAGSDPEVTQQYDHKLYVINADGSDLRQVTSGDVSDADPTWSPDRELIAFHRNCGLWVIRPDGSDARMLLEESDKFCAVVIVWSPDSQRIAFLNESLSEIWVINRDGTDPRVVYSFEQRPEWVNVAWNPDGRQVACWYRDSGGEKGLLINADGSGEPKKIGEMPWSWHPNFWPQWGGEELTPLPLAPVSPGSPPTDAVGLTPCQWDDLGPGLCISPLRGGPPTKILEDTELEFQGPPSWSPDGRQIAFSALEPGESPDRDTTIYIVNADGSGLTELLSLGNDISPAWSPDGEWLAFHSDCNLAIMHPDGSAPTVIWNSEGRTCTFEPQWSPDSQWIVVFMQMEGGGEWTFPMTRELWVISRDGATVTPVVTTTHEDDSCVRPDVAFSPDGMQVAYFDADCQPWIVNADGSGQAVPLTTFPFWWASMVHPQWDGEKEAPPPEPIPPAQPGGGKFLESCEGVMPWQICIRDDESGEVIQVTHDLDFGEPGRTTWSPDGEQIVFNAGSGPDAAGHYDHDLYVIDADGSGLRRITEGETQDLDPSWSPDGEWIAFHRDCGLWLVRPDGSGARELLPESDDFCVGSTSWSPDSQRIAFVDWHAEDDIHETWVVGRDGRDPHVVYAFQRVVDWIVSAWSPDGSQLACIYGGEGWSEGLVFDPEGGEPELLEENELPWHWDSNFWPQWGGERGAPPPALKPISPGNPPPDAREIEPCQWDNRGPGLCLYPLGDGEPIKILEDTELEVSEGGPPSWSPDGRQIAFSAIEPGERGDHDSNIYIVSADGTGLTELPQMGNDVRPAWSPDGEWVAFHSSGDLAIMHPDGSDPTAIWRGQGCTEEPQWSPDSQWIAVIIQTESCEWAFPMTREVRVISRDGATINTIAAMTHENGECVWSEVAFSPDGKQVAYNDANCMPWIVNADGSGQAMPLEGFPFWWKSTVHPQWGGEMGVLLPEPGPPAQPKEGKIVEPCEGSMPTQICMRDARTGSVTQVTDSLEFGQIGWCTWSPDGQQIVFNAGSDSEVTQQYDHKLYVINADGSDLRQITSGDENDVDPAWSPDREWIAFHRGCGLWVIRPDGSDGRMLLEGSDEFCAVAMAWSPDSRQIAFWDVTLSEIWVINRDGTDPRVVYSFEQPPEWVGVAWNPDGRQIACWYQDTGGEKGFLINADGSGEPKVIDEMPWSWLPNFWPQWGGEMGAPPPPPPSAPEGAPVPDDPWGQVAVPPGDTIHIGLVAAFSGVWDWLGPAEENVFQMAMEDQGPIKGFPVSFMIADGGCNHEMGAAAAQAMISDPLIVGVIGHTCSSSCTPAASVYEGAHLVMISPSCTGVDLSQLGYQIFNRVMVRDDQGGDERNLQPVNTDVYQDFAHRYQNRYGQSLLDEEWGVIAAYAYDATVILIRAIERVAVLDETGNLVIGRQALANAVRATPGYQGVTGVISFDGQGDRLP